MAEIHSGVTDRLLRCSYSCRPTDDREYYWYTAVSPWSTSNTFITELCAFAHVWPMAKRAQYARFGADVNM